jgi:hypothetical protein
MKVIRNYGIAAIAYLLMIAAVYAQSSSHTGDYCISCHQKYSFEKAYASELPAVVKNPDVLNLKPCNNELCHRSKPPGMVLVDRYSLHLKENICGNCHPKSDNKFDIHKIHSDFAELDLDRAPVECRICHTPEGFNSPHASVPVYNVTGDPLENIQTPPWKGECSYCHPSVNGSKRLHETHKPALKSACAFCHGDAILSREDLILKVAGDISEVEKEKKIKPREESVILTAFSRLFNEIAYQMYNALRGILI